MILLCLLSARGVSKFARHESQRFEDEVCDIVWCGDTSGESPASIGLGVSLAVLERTTDFDEAV